MVLDISFENENLKIASTIHALKGSILVARNLALPFISILVSFMLCFCAVGTKAHN